jgi:hypothetical protein
MLSGKLIVEWLDRQDFEHWIRLGRHHNGRQRYLLVAELDPLVRECSRDLSR